MKTNSKQSSNTRIVSKKRSRQQIQKKLETALANLKNELGEKKFKRRIKKAGKLLTNGLYKTMKKDNKNSKGKKITTKSVSSS